MATKRPTSIYGGKLKQMPDGDTLPPGNLDLASQSEAETGTNNTKVMTPLRTAQAISALGGGGGGVSDGLAIAYAIALG